MRIIDSNCWVLYCSLTVVVVASVLSRTAIKTSLVESRTTISYKSCHRWIYLEYLDRTTLHRFLSCTIDWIDSTIWKWTCAMHRYYCGDDRVLFPRVFSRRHVTRRWTCESDAGFCQCQFTSRHRSCQCEAKISTDKDWNKLVWHCSIMSEQ